MIAWGNIETIGEVRALAPEAFSALDAMRPAAAEIDIAGPMAA